MCIAPTTLSLPISTGDIDWIRDFAANSAVDIHRGRATSRSAARAWSKAPRPSGLTDRLARAVTGAGTYKLKVKAKGNCKRTLFATARSRSRPWSHSGRLARPISGDAVHDTKKIKLKRASPAFCHWAKWCLNR
jgi:hypothetical protein